MEEEKNTVEKEKAPSNTNKSSDGSPIQLGWAFLLIESVKDFLSISFIFKFIILVFVFFVCVEGTTNYFYFQRLEKKVSILSELKKQATDKVNIEKTVDKELNDIASEMSEYQTNKPEIEIVTKYLSNTLLPNINVTDTSFSLVSEDKRQVKRIN